MLNRRIAVWFLVIFLGLIGVVLSVPPATSSAASGPGLRLQAETMATRTVGGLDGSGWNIWSNGLIEDWIMIDETGTHRIAVKARGRSDSVTEPMMELRIGGRTVGSSSVAVANGYDTYSFEVDLAAGLSRLAVAFVNDPNRVGNDVDLVVDWVAITPIDPTVSTNPSTITTNPPRITTTRPTVTSTPPTDTTGGVSTTIQPTTTSPPTNPTTSAIDGGVPADCPAPTGIVHQFRGEDGVDNWTGNINFTTPEQPHTREDITGPSRLVPYGDASMKLEIKSGDPQRTADVGQGAKRRAEFAWSDWRYDSNAEGWVGGAFYLPADPMATNKGTAIFQLHNWPEVGTLWNIHTWNGKLRSNNDPAGRVFEADIEPYLDRWVRVVVNFKSSTGSDGFLRMWLNDELVVDLKGPTRPGGKLGPYFKHGVYFWGYGKHDTTRRAVAYFDNLRIGDSSSSYDSVNPACWQ